MQVKCPKCRLQVPVRNVSLDAGWAKCQVCNEIFPLADVEGYQPGTAAPPAIERPFDAWAKVLRTVQNLRVVVPPKGMRAGTNALLAFATTWLSFTGFLSYTFHRGAAGDFDWFMIPFWGVGFLLLGTVVWQSRGCHSVYLDANQMVTGLRCLFWRRRRIISRNQVQCARRGVAIVKDDNSTYQPNSVEIVYENGSFPLPCNSLAEEAWLIGEINDFLKSTPYSPLSTELYRPEEF